MATVLAAVDPLAVDLAPVRFAAAVAGHTGAPLFLASVFAGDDVLEPLAGAQQGEELGRDPGDALAGLAGDLRRDGIKAETLALGAASAPRGLELAAVEMGAALVVVGSAARAEAGRLAPGSTAARLLDGATCAVALVPRGWDWRLRTIAAGYVDTAEGRDAVHGAHALARRAGARLRVLAVVQPRDWMDAPDEGDLRTRAEQAAEAAVSGLLGEPVDVDVSVGEPAEVLYAETSAVDALVCGARGYGATPAALLGGVTRRVTDGGACPLIVTARGAERRLEDLLT
jgi:nucleotide-binding universal stress UspA family protein